MHQINENNTQNMLNIYNSLLNVGQLYYKHQKIDGYILFHYRALVKIYIEMH